MPIGNEQRVILWTGGEGLGQFSREQVIHECPETIKSSAHWHDILKEMVGLMLSEARDSSHFIRHLRKLAYFVGVFMNAEGQYQESDLLYSSSSEEESGFGLSSPSASPSSSEGDAVDKKVVKLEQKLDNIGRRIQSVQVRDLMRLVWQKEKIKRYIVRLLYLRREGRDYEPQPGISFADTDDYKTFEENLKKIRKIRGLQEVYNALKVARGQVKAQVKEQAIKKQPFNAHEAFWALCCDKIFHTAENHAISMYEFMADLTKQANKRAEDRAKIEKERAEDTEKKLAEQADKHAEERAEDRAEIAQLRNELRIALQKITKPEDSHTTSLSATGQKRKREEPIEEKSKKRASVADPDVSSSNPPSPSFFKS